jgi:rhodanese-related sulfurtransferase
MTGDRIVRTRRPEPELETITPTELYALARTTPVRLIDVRTPAEFARIHARGAESVPARRLDATALGGSSDPIYLICRGGTRAADVCERLAAEAPTVRAVVVEGGTLAWEAAGLPVDRARDWRAYLRRSSRVGGVLLILSILLAVVIHPGLLGLVGFVGAALVVNQMVVNHFLDRSFRAESD